MLQRDPKNPILTREDLPEFPGVPDLRDPSSVFNPGAVEFEGRVHLMLRVQSRSRSTHLVLASSEDGRSFEVADEVVQFEGIEREERCLYHIYDPRLTRIDEEILVCFAADSDEGCFLGTARTRDLRSFEFLALGQEPARNGVIFPEKVGGRYLRLERPNRSVTDGGVATGDSIWLAESDDLLDWTPVGEVFSGRPHYWDELIGSGPPPIRTAAGWLHLYHGVATHFASSNIYQAGVVLLDLDDPTKVIGRSPGNILEPRELCELTGQVPNVVFPSGMVAPGEGGEVLVYYGAADSSVCLATTTVGELLAGCEE
jgi:beta-1,4-mannooligosaccharide/beta-1,4-mannosyl-N-acetylglucosamine phosphorylase